LQILQQTYPWYKSPRDTKIKGRLFKLATFLLFIPFKMAISFSLTLAAFA